LRLRILKLLGLSCRQQRSFFILGGFSQAFSIEFFNTAAKNGLDWVAGLI